MRNIIKNNLNKDYLKKRKKTENGLNENKFYILTLYRCLQNKFTAN